MIDFTDSELLDFLAKELDDFPSLWGVVDIRFGVRARLDGNCSCEYELAMLLLLETLLVDFIETTEDLLMGTLQI